MKKYLVLAMCLILLAVMVGCGKKSSLEGKVVDGKGKPLAGVKLHALQEQPLKGYESFECTTGSDGSFKFGKLFPTSAYQLITQLDDTPSNFQSITIMSAPEGQTMILPEPITIQKTSLEGKIVDGKGRPLAGVKLFAVRLNQSSVEGKGHGMPVSTSGADGSFKFNSLFPNSAYNLDIVDGGEPTIKTESGPEGQTKKLSEPITIRMQLSKDAGTALDTKTGLMWSINANIADRAMNWDAAMKWVKELDIGGHRDWRLPSKEELGEFGKFAGSNREFKNVQSNWYWTNTEGINSKVWSVSMSTFNVDEPGSTSSANSNKRELNLVWPVRVGQ